MKKRKEFIFLLFVCLCFVFSKSADIAKPPGCKGAFENGHRANRDQQNTMYGNCWEAINRLLNCSAITDAEKGAIQKGPYTLVIDPAPWGDPTACGGSGANFPGTKPVWLNSNYFNNPGSLGECCKVPLWSTIGHELIHNTIAPAPPGGSHLSECKAHWLESTCLNPEKPGCGEQSCCEKEFEDWKNKRTK